MSDENPPIVSGVSEQKQRSRAGGRPKYKPTDEQRDLVRKLVAEKLPQTEIAKQIGVAPVTLRRAFVEELKKADQAGQLDFDTPRTGAESPAAEPGRPEFEPTLRQREEVVYGKAIDWSDDKIAKFLGISRTTLLKHFDDELTQGVDTLRIQVVRDLRNAARKSAAAAEKFLRLPGMIGGAQALPTPEAPTDEVERLGKKEQAERRAVTAHQGTSWGELGLPVKH